jgi:acyl carrier protein
VKRSDFVNKLAEFCEFEDQKLKPETQLKSIEGYDSLSIMSMIAFVDENFRVRLTAKQIQELTDFNSVISLIGEDKFEND